jgi:hypothetical protein
MKRLVPVVVAAAVLAGPASAAPTVRLAIVHVMRGCHVFATAAKELGAAPTITVKRGTRVELRVNCPMDFDLVQNAGPRLKSPPRLYAGTTTPFVFAKRGVYVFTARNVQTPEEAGLQVMGGVNTLTLRVRVT